MSGRLKAASALAAVCLAAALAGCSSDGCQHNRSSIPMAGFYDFASREPLNVSGLAVSGVGAPGDSLLLDADTNSHQVYLPFRGSQPTADFRFAYGAFADHVEFTYESYPYFDGEECGAMWRYRITGVRWSGLLIDSVAVTDSLITNIERERIMIFITVPEPEPEPEPEP